MKSANPIPAITVDRLAPERFREFVLASEYGHYPGHLSLGAIQGISNPKVDLFFAPPDDLSLRFISSEPLTFEALDEVQIACTYLATHPDTVFEAVRAIFPAEASTGTLNLSLKLICPGFTNNNWRDAMHSPPYPIEVLELALATDAHGRQSLIARSNQFRKQQRKPITPLGRRVRRPKQHIRHEHEPPPRTRIALGYPLRRSTALNPKEAELQEIDAFLLELLPDPTAIRKRSRSKEFDRLNRTQSNLRTYAMTVALSARLLFLSTPPHAKTNRGSKTLSPSRARRMLRDFLPILEALASYFAKTAPDLFALRLPRSEGPRDLDSMLKKLALKYRTRHASLSANWQTGVPSTFAAFLEEMLPSAVGLPQDIAFRANLTESAEQILGNAAVGVIASVYAASSCDMLWRYPETFFTNPFKSSLTPTGAFSAVPSLWVLRADLVRVVCAHRVMLEMAGLPDRAIAVAMLSQAVRVAQEVRTKVVLGYQNDLSRAEVWASGQDSLVSLQVKDTLKTSKKNESELLHRCVAQERDMRRFFAAVP